MTGPSKRATARLYGVCGAVGLLAEIVLALASAAARAAGMVCSEFSTQAAAQAFYLGQGGPVSHPHRLNANGDGVACESLPCPCATGAPPTPPTPAAGSSAGARSGAGPEPAPAPEQRRTAEVLRGQLDRLA